jgi:hypothetical protein
MTRLSVLVVVFGMTAGAALGQPPGPPAGGLLDIEQLAILLDLDAYQKGEVERVLEEQREAFRAAREERAAAVEPPLRDDKQARRAQEGEELIGKLRNTLTAQQIQKLEIVIEMQRGMRGPRAATF